MPAPGHRLLPERLHPPDAPRRDYPTAAALPCATDRRATRIRRPAPARHRRYSSALPDFHATKKMPRDARFPF